MKALPVACAILEREGKVCAAQRSGSMSLPFKWEFPGGKIEGRENPEECLRREVREELGIEISVGRPLTPTTHRYSSFTVTLYPFLSTIVSGAITLHEHAALAWLLPEELRSLDWAEADWPVLDEYLRLQRDAFDGK